SSSTLTVTNTLTLALNPATTLTAGSLTTNLDSTPITTPEPATLALFAVGGLALLVGTRRRHNRA
ncbi:MAG: PEP-CTERM sorting domain-containing protein, partial [Phycisphaerae bacterium]